MADITSSATGISFNDTRIAFGHHPDSWVSKTRMLFWLMNQPASVKYGAPLASWSLKVGLPVKGLIKATLFDHFCGGEDIASCQKTINELWKQRVGTILDYSVEGEKTDSGFDKTRDETIATIKKAAGNPSIPFSVFKVTGIAAFDLLEKMNRRHAPEPDYEAQWNKVVERMDLICKTAHDLGVRIFVDAEESWIQDSIDRLALQMMVKYNKERPIVFNTYQLYRHQSLANLKKDFDFAVSNNVYFGAKLVRGAYMEKERKRAGELGYQDPIQPNLQATHHDYDSAILFCLNHIENIAFCAGTHNEKSSLLLADEMSKRGIAQHDERIWFSQLLGMSDNISFNLAAHGYNVAKYVPYGPVEAVMPYLTRRAQENTAIAGQTSREFALINAEYKRRKNK